MGRILLWIVPGLAVAGGLAFVHLEPGADADPIQADAPAVGIRFTLPQSVTLRGRLTGLSATEAPTWTIYLLTTRGAIKKTAKVSEAGRWHIPGIAADAAYYVCAGSRDDDRYAKRGPITAAGQEITLALRQGQAISGCVGRTAAPDGVVRVWLNDGWYASGQAADDGSFVIRGVPSGRDTLQALCGSARAKREKVPAGAADVVLQLALPE